MAERSEYPVPEGARRVLLFGGTFDPPHRAHVELPVAAREAVEADWLLYIPAGRSPHKEENPAASDADRMDMLDAALRDADRVSISTIEIGPGGDGAQRAPSYTVKTLERLRTLAGDAELRLLIGADQAASFHRWREPRRIIEVAEPVVMLRSPHDDRGALLETIREHWSAMEAERWSGRIVDVPLIDVSATRVRELLRAGALDDPELRRALPGPVLEIIRDRGLYREP